MRLRRKRLASSVEADRVDAAAQVLQRWNTRGSRQSALYSYKREHRQQGPGRGAPYTLIPTRPPKNSTREIVWVPSAVRNHKRISR